MTDRPDSWRHFPAVLEQIVKGELPPPNLEPMTNDEAVTNIATFSYHVTKGSFRAADGHRGWATYFTGGTQAGQFDGAGFVLYYDRGEGKAAKFAICRHTPKEGANANHMRGWHPAHCTSCGLDMSVDSGD